ncbi:hypothetical protein HHI36_024177, partial [Cryptolaemus montrouzieri]
VKIDEINQKALSVDQKLSTIDSKISKVDYISSTQFADNIANEAVDRIIRGIPESAGDLSAKIEHDIEIVDDVLRTLECDSAPTTLFRIGKSNNKHPRMIKIVMNNEQDTKRILRNKNKLLERPLLKIK